MTRRYAFHDYKWLLLLVGFSEKEQEGEDTETDQQTQHGVDVNHETRDYKWLLLLVGFSEKEQEGEDAETNQQSEQGVDVNHETVLQKERMYNQILERW